MRQDLLNAIRRLISHELMLLRRLAHDRRLASSRMPKMIRTGPGASSRREAA